MLKKLRVISILLCGVIFLNGLCMGSASAAYTPTQLISSEKEQSIVEQIEHDRHVQGNFGNIINTIGQYYQEKDSKSQSKYSEEFKVYCLSVLFKLYNEILKSGTLVRIPNIKKAIRTGIGLLGGLDDNKNLEYPALLRRVLGLELDKNRNRSIRQRLDSEDKDISQHMETILTNGKELLFTTDFKWESFGKLPMVTQLNLLRCVGICAENGLLLSSEELHNILKQISGLNFEEYQNDLKGKGTTNLTTSLSSSSFSKEDNIKRTKNLEVKILIQFARIHSDNATKQTSALKAVIKHFGGVAYAAKEDQGREALIQLGKIKYNTNEQVSALNAVIKHFGGVAYAAQKDQGREALIQLGRIPHNDSKEQISALNAVIKHFGGPACAANYDQGREALLQRCRIPDNNYSEKVDILIILEEKNYKHNDIINIAYHIDSAVQRMQRSNKRISNIIYKENTLESLKTLKQKVDEMNNNDVQNHYDTYSSNNSKQGNNRSKVMENKKGSHEKISNFYYKSSSHSTPSSQSSSLSPNMISNSPSLVSYNSSPSSSSSPVSRGRKNSLSPPPPLPCSTSSSSSSSSNPSSVPFSFVLSNLPNLLNNNSKSPSLVSNNSLSSSSTPVSQVRKNSLSTPPKFQSLDGQLPTTLTSTSSLSSSPSTSSSGSSSVSPNMMISKSPSSGPNNSPSSSSSPVSRGRKNSLSPPPPLPCSTSSSSSSSSNPSSVPFSFVLSNLPNLLNNNSKSPSLVSDNSLSSSSTPVSQVRKNSLSTPPKFQSLDGQLPTTLTSTSSLSSSPSTSSSGSSSSPSVSSSNSLLPSTSSSGSPSLRLLKFSSLNLSSHLPCFCPKNMNQSNNNQNQQQVRYDYNNVTSQIYPYSPSCNTSNILTQFSSPSSQSKCSKEGPPINAIETERTAMNVQQIKELIQLGKMQQQYSDNERIRALKAVINYFGNFADAAMDENGREALIQLGRIPHDIVEEVSALNAVIEHFGNFQDAAEDEKQGREALLQRCRIPDDDNSKKVAILEVLKKKNCSLEEIDKIANNIFNSLRYKEGDFFYELRGRLNIILGRDYGFNNKLPNNSNQNHVYMNTPLPSLSVLNRYNNSISLPLPSNVSPMPSPQFQIVTATPPCNSNSMSFSNENIPYIANNYPNQ